MSLIIEAAGKSKANEFWEDHNKEKHIWYWMFQSSQSVTGHSSAKVMNQTPAWMGESYDEEEKLQFLPHFKLGVRGSSRMVPSREASYGMLSSQDWKCVAVQFLITCINPCPQRNELRMLKSSGNNWAATHAAFQASALKVKHKQFVRGFLHFTAIWC